MTATVSDKAGNPASADHGWRWTSLRRISPLIPSQAMTYQRHRTWSGACHQRNQHGRGAGDVVTVNLNGKNYTTTLDVPVTGASAFRRWMSRRWQREPDHYRQPERSRGQQRQHYPYVTVDLSGPMLTISTVSGDDTLIMRRKPRI